MGSNKALGDWGEALATKFLLDKGYKILETNYLVRYCGEIDIIARRQNLIAFVEVKYRSSLKYGHPREAVGYTKQKKIKKTAMMYMASKKIQGVDLRFDVIEILEDGELKLEHIENAF